MSLVINLKAETGLVDRTENTNRFYEDIRKYPTLTKEEEFKWFTQYRNGTSKEREEARDYIIKCNQRLVVSVAKKWATTDTLMDYVNEVNKGLMQAIDAFDPNLGLKFSNIAMYYFKRAINHYNTETVPMVRRTNNSKTAHVISKATNDFIQKHERNPSSDELMDIVNNKYGKNVKDKHDLTLVQITRIDSSESDGGDEDPSYGDAQEYDRVSATHNGYEDTVSKDFNTKVVRMLLSKLQPREREIIELSFGLSEHNGFKREHELAEIAKIMGLTAERVRQLKVASLNKLKDLYIRKVRGAV